MAQALNIPAAQSISEGMAQAGGYQNQGCTNHQSFVNQSSANRSSVNQGSANQNSINQSSANAGYKPQTLEKPQNIAPKFPVYVLGESFHYFITTYDSILKRYGMMDEAALRLSERLSQPALYLYLSLPEGIRFDYTQTVAAWRSFWDAVPAVTHFLDSNEKYGLPVLVHGQDSVEIFATKIGYVASSFANGDTQRYDRLAKYLLWKGLSIDASLWIEECYDDSINFLDIHLLCWRLLVSANKLNAPTQQVHFNTPSSPQVVACGSQFILKQ